MATPRNLQYVSDAEGHTTAVIVPIELWNEIASERETAYLLKSPEMKERLFKAKSSTEGVSLLDAQSRLRI